MRADGPCTGPAAKTTLIPDRACTSRTAARSASRSSGRAVAGRDTGASSRDRTTVSQVTLAQVATAVGGPARTGVAAPRTPGRPCPGTRPHDRGAHPMPGTATTAYREARDQLLGLRGDPVRAAAEFRWPHVEGPFNWAV